MIFQEIFKVYIERFTLKIESFLSFSPHFPLRERNFPHIFRSKRCCDKKIAENNDLSTESLIQSSLNRSRKRIAFRVSENPENLLSVLKQSLSVAKISEDNWQGSVHKSTE